MSRSDLAEVAADLESALLAGQVADKKDLQALKHRLARRHGLHAFPTDADLASALAPDVARRWAHVLRTKPMRSGSGVAIVAVMSSPAACPHGKCVYCPGGPDVDAPQSYTGFEPSTMRAKRFDYDPYRVVRSRLWVLERNGHAIDKVDAIVQGGTFPARDEAYQDWFIARIYHACNDGPDDAPDPDPADGLAAWQNMTPAERGARLGKAQHDNETARCRVIGLTVETKPDWCFEPHLAKMLEQGVTRIELGIQTLDEETTRLTNRGHTVADAARAMHLARDAGFKVCVHMMPGLPRAPLADGTRPTDPAADIEDMRRLFAEAAWRPDMLKVYPTLVVQEGDTPLKRWWQEGKYQPYDAQQATDVLRQALQHVPPYCRIQRVDRDIPTTHVQAGVEKSNLRQLVETAMEHDGHPLRDVRAREVQRKGGDVGELRIRSYDASDGREHFISFEDPDMDSLSGFVRVRIVAGAMAPLAAGTAVVRELKVYGTALAVGDHDERAWQHQGLGRRLMAAAEEQARAAGAGEIRVLAGPGVKPYYRRLGYQDDGAYLLKALTTPPAS